MAQFEFKAFTQEGKLKEGIISAESKDKALQILQEQNLLVTYLGERKRKPLFFQKPRLKDIYIFTRQLSYLIQANTPLDESIRSLSETTASSSLKGILIEIYNELVGGAKLSTALSRFPDLFNSYYIGMIQVGESTGALDEVLFYLANHLEAQMKFRNRALQALIYPALVLVIFLGVLITLFYYVIPQITNIFVENNIPLPSVTKFFQSISNIIVRYGIFFLFILMALIYYTFEYFKTREGKVFLFNLVNGLPIFGPLFKNIYIAQFLESLYYLEKGGVTLVDSLEIIKNTINHPLYESAIQSMIEEIKKGKPLSQAMSEFPDLFHTIVIEAMKTGEKTGQLSAITLTILNYYNEIINNQLNTLGESLQPFLIIIFAIGLGALEASLLIPLLNLTKYVQSF
jgi:type IV pilus assembly protein PilC